MKMNKLHFTKVKIDKERGLINCEVYYNEELVCTVEDDPQKNVRVTCGNHENQTWYNQSLKGIEQLIWDIKGI